MPRITYIHEVTGSVLEQTAVCVCGRLAAVCYCNGIEFSRDLLMGLNGCVLLVCLLLGAEVLSHFVKSWASGLDGHCTSTDNKAEVNTL